MEEECQETSSPSVKHTVHAIDMDMRKVLRLKDGGIAAHHAENQHGLAVVTSGCTIEA